MTSTKIQASAQGVVITAAVALAVLLFAGTASADTNLGDVNVTNTNNATVTNNVDTDATTGFNYAAGSYAGDAGNGGNGGDNAGDGDDGGRGGSRGDGGNGGRGGDTGTGGRGGNGGNSGLGGYVGTGAAQAGTSVENTVNTNSTTVDTSSCGCEVEPQYNIWRAGRSFDASRTEVGYTNDRGSSYYHYEEDEHGFFGTDVEETRRNDRGQVDASYETGSVSYDSSMYSKTANDVDHGDVNVRNTNSSANVSNSVDTDATTGFNRAGGSEAGNGGSGGRGGNNAGDGDDGGNGGSRYGYRFFGGFGSNDGGNGGRGGDTGNGAQGGNGGDSSNGGEVVTGTSDAATVVSNDVNRNTSRVTR